MKSRPPIVVDSVSTVFVKNSLKLHVWPAIFSISPCPDYIGLVKCGTFDCGNQLGTMQNFLNFHPPDGYALKAQSFKIHYETGGVKTPKVWKKAGFVILVKENP